MALKINDLCVNCWACVSVCPTESIVQAQAFCHQSQDVYGMRKAFEDPECASICPIEGAIVDRERRPLNPPGSLTGIPPELAAQVAAEIRAR